MASIKKTDTLERIEKRPARRTSRAGASISTNSVTVVLSASLLAKAGSGPPCSSSSGVNTLVIGDSVTRNIKLHSEPAKVIRLPGARAPNIKANLRVLACS